ncbi:MAG TPA: hypothetical protein VFA20_06480 [Myxococcaceae bacterium]|nr:hypothetical protein [Myxococcaceae bacterium]
MPILPRSGRIYLVYAAIGLFDLARVLWPPSPRPADEIEPSWLFHRARVVGLAHTEKVLRYRIATYRTYPSGIPIGEPIEVEPFVLIPLNVPDRSEGRLTLLELPADAPALASDFDGVEYTGLLGPVPDDLWVHVPQTKGGPRPMRLQPSAAPSVVVSLFILAGVAWALRMLRKAERRGLQSTGMSGLCFFLAQLPVLYLLAVRLRLHPAGNQLAPWALAAFFHALLFAGALMTMRVPRPDDDASAPLSDEAFAAASAAHDELLSRRGR